MMIAKMPNKIGKVIVVIYNTKLLNKLKVYLNPINTFNAKQIYFAQ